MPLGIGIGLKRRDDNGGGTVEPVPPYFINLLMPKDRSITSVLMQFQVKLEYHQVAELNLTLTLYLILKNFFGYQIILILGTSGLSKQQTLTLIKQDL